MIPNAAAPIMRCKDRNRDGRLFPVDDLTVDVLHDDEITAASKDLQVIRGAKHKEDVPDLQRQVAQDLLFVMNPSSFDRDDLNMGVQLPLLAQAAWSPPARTAAG